MTAKHRHPWDATPSARGLYDPKYEIDGCGVGAICHLKAEESRSIVDDAETMLIRMAHRGATTRPQDGDGAGILLSIPDEFLRAVVDFELPPLWQYGVGNVFLAQAENKRGGIVALLKRAATRCGLKLLGSRDVPRDSSYLGPYAKQTEPGICQFFFASAHDGLGTRNEESETSGGEMGTPEARRRKPTAAADLSLDTKLFLLRRFIAARAKEIYFCSLSSRILTYKGQFTPDQLFKYFKDLSDPRCKAYMAVVHSRFSTNSFPSWSRAHPHRMIAHNGEINTFEGNRNFMRAREANMQSKQFGNINIEKFFPIDEDIGSDSSFLDNVLETLVAGGRDIAEAMLLIIPEAWENDTTMCQKKRAFYEYNSCLMEPWDGPALVIFSDGRQLGATLDRNGLRPGRYYVTKDDRMILASEVGVVDVASDNILRKGRLEPGRMLLADFEERRLIDNDELKMSYACRRPYQQWLDTHLVYLKNILIDIPDSDERTMEMLMDTEGEPRVSEGDEDDADAQHTVPLVKWLTMFGFTYEKVEMLLTPMVKTKNEPLGSMGQDMPLAFLSSLPRNPFDYFSQLFAQATNPAIDPMREGNVMSLGAPIGPEKNLLEPGPLNCHRIFVDDPLLCPRSFAALIELGNSDSTFLVASLDMTFDAKKDCSRVAWGVSGGSQKQRCQLEERLDQLCEEAVSAIQDGAGLLILSHREASVHRVPIPSLLALGRVHQMLISKRKRTQVALIVEGGDCFEIHHHAMLLAYGTDAIYPYMCYAALSRVRVKEPMQLSLTTRIDNYRAAASFGILKVMSKMGVSCIKSYKSSQNFQAIGVSHKVMDKCFTGTSAVLHGVCFPTFENDARRFHQMAFPPVELPPLVDSSLTELPDFGEYHFRAVNETEYHINSPDVIMRLQEAASNNSYTAYEEFAEWQNKINEETEIRGQLDIAFESAEPIPLESVESVENILKRFSTGAISLGAISDEAHKALALSMNRIGGKSNTGEGGEEAARKFDLHEGEIKMGKAKWRIGEGETFRSRIKQVASGRFGVTLDYLVSADELQIKLAQGAKPGEGGELPGFKVVGKIAETRSSTPGVGLISPPPHHDMYSIEDVAQLISDLKHVNPTARISVKLVARIGVGIIASGIVKGKTDHLTISGASGGTGAAKWTSIKRTGLPWELGVAETHQTLVLNGLRDKVVLATDGQIRTGKDCLYAMLLGADEISMSTAPLIALGCIMMRKCHLNTCPVGIATQDPELRAKFAGHPEHVVNYFFMVVNELRGYMARLGIARVKDLVGRVDLLRPKASLNEHKKRSMIDFSSLLQPAWTISITRDHEEECNNDTVAVKQSSALCGSKDSNAEEDYNLCCAVSREEILQNSLDRVLINKLQPTFQRRRPAVLRNIPISNANRSCGALLSYELCKRLGNDALLDNTVKICFHGSAGQSFGAFLSKGVTFELEGDANDYVGKGLSGGNLFIFPPKALLPKASDHVIVGNATLYGATSGRAYICGKAAERCGVRNSGAIIVVEGCGDHGCEYMTKGLAVVLGRTGRNFAAGMSGGIAYVLDLDENKVNSQTVFVEKCTDSDGSTIFALLEDYVEKTKSPLATELIHGDSFKHQRFSKIFPREYKKVLKEAIQEHIRVGSRMAGRILEEFEKMKQPVMRTHTEFASSLLMPRTVEELAAKYQQFRGSVTGLIGMSVPGAPMRESGGIGMAQAITDTTLSALGLGDIAPYYMEVMSTLNPRGSAASTFRAGYLMWRVKYGNARAGQNKLKLEYNIDDSALQAKYPIGWTKFQNSCKTMETNSKWVDNELPPAAPDNPTAKKTDADVLDLEDISKESRPTEVAFSSKRKGFHIYARKGTAYRDPQERIFDYEEIYSDVVNRSKRWYQLMETQTARCMDCGTPTCHYPNQKGGGCPLSNRIPTWNSLVHDNDWKMALERLLDTNNFPEFTGTTCPAPCEEACVLAINESPVAIKSVEQAIIEHGFAKGWVVAHLPKFHSGKKVVIVGSGPAGLAAAQQLNRAGHQVFVLEREDQIGGLLTYGIPNMKLAKWRVQRRVDLLKQEGIQFECNTALGKNGCTLESLWQRFDAVLLATGSTIARPLPDFLQKDHDFKNIVQALDFLIIAQKQLKGKDVDTPDVSNKHCVVLGGGDTAVDAVATLIRMGAASVVQFTRRGKPPAERTAGTQWPAWGDCFRVDYAHGEYVSVAGRDPREYLVQVKELVPAKNDPTRVASIITRQAGKEQVFPADLVVLAIGFMGPDVSGMESLMRDEHNNFLTSRGSYSAHSVATDGSSPAQLNRVFVAGDCRHGASLVVTAIAEGRDAARQIDVFLMGHSSLPRCIPLARNPALLKLEWASEVQTTKVPRHRLRKKTIVSNGPKVSAAFERGFLADEMELPKTPMSRNVSRVESRLLQEKPNPSLEDFTSGAESGTRPGDTPSNATPLEPVVRENDRAVKFALGSLVAMNVVLVVALLFQRR
eukprot:GEMP01000168.1.p1 GENE.GEMP01000168.1~~GEMP01000168.1.p1  ORF type:complete len:2460 (+),score=682.77 GEMP01000168.1:153-7532(+)